MPSPAIAPGWHRVSIGKFSSLLDNARLDPKHFATVTCGRDDWFGTASPVNEDHVVDSGRWGFLNLAKDDGQGHLQIKVGYLVLTTPPDLSQPSHEHNTSQNPYGLLRSPWNTNNVPYLTRSRYTYNQKDGGWSLPSCAEFAQFFDEVLTQSWRSRGLHEAMSFTT